MALGWSHYPVWNSERYLRLLWHLVGTTTKCGRRLRLLRHLVGTPTKHKIEENVWDYYGTRLEPLRSIKWWKMSETPKILGRNHYQAWNSRRRLRLLQHSAGTTTKYGRRLRLLQHLVRSITKYRMVENVWDCYDTQSELLLNLE